jgi:hypothetical protein
MTTAIDLQVQAQPESEFVRVHSERPIAQPETYVEPDWVRLYGEQLLAQHEVDKRLMGDRYTGTTHDIVTNDWIVWVLGQVVGWDRTPNGAQQRAENCLRAKIEAA